MLRMCDQKETVMPQTQHYTYTLNLRMSRQTHVNGLTLLPLPSSYASTELNTYFKSHGTWFLHLSLGRSLLGMAFFNHHLFNQF